MLFCSIDIPLLAHTGDLGPTHHAMVLDGHVDVESSSNQGGDQFSTPDHVLRHHCPGEMLARLPALDLIERSERPPLFSLIAMRLAPRSFARSLTTLRS